jgi:hypothetical protein
VAQAPGLVILTDKPASYPLPEAAPARRRMEEVRKLRDAEGQRARATDAEQAAKAQRALASTRVTLQFEATPLADVLHTVQTMIDVPVLMDKRIPAKATKATVTAKLEDVTAQEALKKVLAPYELDWVLRDGSVLVVPVTDAIREGRERKLLEAQRARWEARLNEIEATEVAADLSGKRPREIARALAQASKFPVYPDPLVWSSSRKLKDTPAPRTIREVRAALDAIGVRQVIEADGIYLLAKTPRKPAPPAK